MTLKLEHSFQDANDIFSVIKTAFSEKCLQEVMSNIVFLASDGTSVNTWLKNGWTKLYIDKMS